MKNLILLACLFISVCTFAQSEKQNLLDEIEVSPPQFTGIQNVAPTLIENNSDLVKNYLVKNVIYPEKAVQLFQEGTEIVQFTITSEGRATDFIVLNSVSKDIDDEVIRVLENTSGMWKPGLNNGIPTAMQKEVSMLFKVDGTDINAIVEHFTEKARHHFSIAAKNLFIKHNTKKALRQFNMGMQYLPYDKSLLTLRGLCKYELGDEEGARNDWDRINKLAGQNLTKSENYLTYDTSELKGFAEMNNILKR
ncbi:MAG: energy transducer TonB [Bacteroidetes bacterium]|nr:energy transducer TonB [Bacteroidota bacterium]